MRRREFAVLFGSAVAAWPIAARAQQPASLRVGTANVQPRSAPQWAAFARRMRELGYSEGKNFKYDHVQVRNDKTWETAYREVIAGNPDIIIAAGPEFSLKAALAVSNRLPVVMIAVDYDPIARGYVESLARPKGNVSGVYFQRTELAGKHLQIMKDAFPDLTAVTVFWDRSAADYWAALQAQAPRLGVQLAGVEFRERPYDYERAFVDVPPEYRKFLIANASPFFFLDRERLAEFAIRRRIVSMVASRASVAAGGLMSYGPDLIGMFALAADYVDRIARGDRPADLPIQQPTKFELVVNRKTANELGLTIPESFLLRADEVIE